MKLKTIYLGGHDPFEGDIELMLQGLSEGAQVTRVTIKLEPAMPEGGKLFEEIIDVLSPDIPGDWGATKINSLGSSSDPSSSCDIDFHSRRTLCAVRGRGGVTNLQVDLGGVYIGVVKDGTFFDPENSSCNVNLSDEGIWQKLPGLTVCKLKLYKKEGTPDIDIKAVKIRSTPSNVSVRLAGMPALWTIPGELATARTSLDFAPVLNAFLAGAKAECGVYCLPFIIHSDTIARLNVTICIDYHICLPVLPSFIPEIKLHYGYSGLPDVDKGLMTVNLPRGAKPVEGTIATLSGTFDAGRVAFSSVADPGETDWIDISHDQSLAQPFVLRSEVRGTGIDLHLKAEDGPASLNLAVQEDVDGKPSGKVLAGTDIELEGLSSEESTWLYAKLPAVFRFLKDKRYWLVLQSPAGTAAWQAKLVNSQDEALQSSVDGGFSWRRAKASASEKSLAAVFRVRESPLRFKMPVELQIGEGQNLVRAKFGQFSPLGRVEFEASFAGELKRCLDNMGCSSSCTAGELLVNGSFEEPACGVARNSDIADRIILGIDCCKENGFPAKSGGKMEAVSQASGLFELSIDDIRSEMFENFSSLDKIVSSINQAMGESILSRQGSSIKFHSKEGMTGDVRLYRKCSQVPNGWQTVGHVLRWDHDDSPIAVLIEPLSLLGDSDIASSDLEPATLFQRVEVTEGCTYALSFFYWTAKCILDSIAPSHVVDAVSGSMEEIAAPFYVDLVPPSWEIRWLDCEDQIVDNVTGEIYAPSLSPITFGYMSSYQRILVAPGGSTRAEVRFIQPEPGVLMVREVSFIHNTDLSINATSDTIISQSTGIIGKDRFILSCKVGSSNAAGSAASQESKECARLELQWLAQGTAVGEPLALALGRRDFPDHIWIVTAPEEATQVTVRLVRLTETVDLSLESISFKRMETVSLPLTFVAEAPGELTVSGMKIAYDLT